VGRRMEAEAEEATAGFMTGILSTGAVGFGIVAGAGIGVERGGGFELALCNLGEGVASVIFVAFGLGGCEFRCSRIGVEYSSVGNRVRGWRGGFGGYGDARCEDCCDEMRCASDGRSGDVEFNLVSNYLVGLV
jgi:hypothetical protein